VLEIEGNSEHAEAEGIEKPIATEQKAKTMEKRQRVINSSTI
jgi:hypothetical protein